MDRLDTFANTLTTHSIRIANVSKDIVKNGQLHANQIGAIDPNSELANTWNIFAGNVESMMEATADIMDDFQTYQDLWAEYFKVDIAETKEDKR